MADKTARLRRSSLTLMKAAAGGRAGEGKKGTAKADAGGVAPRVTMTAEPPSRDPKILEVRTLSDLSQPRFRLRYPQGAEEGAANALVKALNATVPGLGTTLGCGLSWTWAGARRR